MISILLCFQNEESYEMYNETVARIFKGATDAHLHKDIRDMIVSRQNGCCFYCQESLR